ncbi:hypothetical protein M5K25_001497 [Dendrobium thyrsiflorum]|uniref:Uncharacterized protein n=1 Tax=Dendrobium thyrsiflorum TaxID=117978 RepID=A0ABD0VQM6_DENTH
MGLMSLLQQRSAPQDEKRQILGVYGLQTDSWIDVWEVQQWRTNPTSGEKVLLSLSNVTLLCNLPSPKEMKSFEDTMKKYSKL